MWLGELTTHCLRGEAHVSNNDSEVILTVKLKEGGCVRLRNYAKGDIFSSCRAAAYIKLQELQKALDDCKHALTLNPTYARAYGRMGYVCMLGSK